MPLLKTATHPNGITITLNDEHRYVDSNNQTYNSVTTVIHELFQKFDAEKVAGFTAKKRGCTREEILKEWETKREASAKFGDKIHKYAESLLTNQKFVDDVEENIEAYKEKESPYMEQIDKIVPKLLSFYDLIGAEKIIFSPEYRLSGTIDLLMRNKRTGLLAIFDWKTNEEIRNVNKHRICQSGIGKLSHIPDCNFFHYAIQLNTYRLLLIKEGYFKNTEYELAIFHVRGNNVIPYKLPLLIEEAEYILDTSKIMKGKENEDLLHNPNRLALPY